MPDPITKRQAAAFLIAFFAITFPLWSNAYLSPPDSASYYSYARSIIRDADIEFANDFRDLQFDLYMAYLTEAGRVSNDWPAGSGLLWIPPFAVAEVVARTANAIGINGTTFDDSSPQRSKLLPKPNSVGATEPLLAPTGQSGIYKLLVTSFTAGCCAVAIWLAMSVAVPIAGRGRSLIAALLVVLGTPVGFYTYAFALMSHMPSMMAASIVLWGWNATRGTRTTKQWVALGMAAGFMVCIRPQEIVVLSVFLVEFFCEVFRGGRREQLAWWRGVGLAFIGAIIGFAPQMIIWNCLYGSPFRFPKLEEMHWFAPELSETLFSAYHGILSWSPILLLVPLGLLFVARKDRVLGIGMAIVLLLQIYLNAANEIWWCGGSFGNRRMVSCGAIFIVAIAALLRAVDWRVVMALATPLAGWNFILWAMERAGRLSLDHYVPWDGPFRDEILKFARPWNVVEGMMGDCAGFGWIPRIILMAIALLGAFAVLKSQFLREPRIFRSLAMLSLGFIAALPFYVGVATVRTRHLDDDDVIPEFPRRNLTLFNGYYEFGFYCHEKGRVEEAIESYQKASDLRPEVAWPYRYLAAIYFDELGDPETALLYSGKALDIDPRYDRAMEVELASINTLIESGAPDGRDLLARAARRLRAAGRNDEAARIEESLKH